VLALLARSVVQRSSHRESSRWVSETFALQRATSMNHHRVLAAGPPGLGGKSRQRAREGGVAPSAQHWRVLTVPETRESYASAAGHGLQARIEILTRPVGPGEQRRSLSHVLPGGRDQPLCAMTPQRRLNPSRGCREKPAFRTCPLYHSNLSLPSDPTAEPDREAPSTDHGEPSSTIPVGWRMRRRNVDAEKPQFQMGLGYGGRAPGTAGGRASVLPAPISQSNFSATPLTAMPLAPYATCFGRAA